MTLDYANFNQANEEELQKQKIDALYQESLLHFQNGRWQQAINGFQAVLQLQPDHEQAKAFLEEAYVKASLEQEKPKPRKFLFQGRLRYLFFALVMISLLLFLAIGVRWAYVRWIQPARIAQQEAKQKSQLLEQAYKYLAEKDYAAAQEAFRTLLAEDPDNEEAQKGLAEAQKKASLAETYAKAKEAIAKQDWDEAASLLAAIAAQDPNYQDVQMQQTLVQEQIELRTRFDQANAAHTAGNWQEAIAGYEKLRDLDAEYQKQTVSERLFESYLQQGRYLIQSTKGDSTAVQRARELFQKALALQPQHPQAMQELSLAEKYLEGQKQLTQGNREAARAALEWVCQQQPEYAGGTASALLKLAGGQPEIAQPAPTGTISAPITSGETFHQQYASAMQRGDTAMDAGDYALAEECYRQATMAAIHGGYDSARWLFVAYVKVGTAYAKSGKFEEAITAIKTAISIMTKSAIAIPAESYSSYIEEAERYTQGRDYHNALIQYDQALRVIGKKCNCGLENWSVVP
nr:tetratricopeptide repeat protein [Chloroflexota bacterium]